MISWITHFTTLWYEVLLLRIGERWSVFCNRYILTQRKTKSRDCYILPRDLANNPPIFDIYKHGCFDGSLEEGYSSQIAVYQSDTDATVMVGGTISCKIDTVVTVNALGVEVTVPMFTGQSVVEEHGGLDLHKIIDGASDNQQRVLRKIYLPEVFCTKNSLKGSFWVRSHFLHYARNKCRFYGYHVCMPNYYQQDTKMFKRK